MSVVSVSLPTRNLARLGVSALQHGVALNSSVVEKDGPVSYVDISGNVEKILYALRANLGAKVLDVTESTAEDGIPEDDEASRIKRYGSLMAGPR